MISLQSPLSPSTCQLAFQVPPEIVSKLTEFIEEPGISPIAKCQLEEHIVQFASFEISF
jgi:hypothetical protein